MFIFNVLLTISYSTQWNIGMIFRLNLNFQIAINWIKAILVEEHLTRCYPKNGVPRRIQTGLENWEKFSSFQILAMWGTPFSYSFFIFKTSSESNNFQIENPCLQFYNRLLFSIYDRKSSYIQRFNLCKEVLFLFQVQRENQPRRLGKSEHLFAKT